MTIHYIYHSCYAVETDQLLLVYDYWKDSPDQRLQRLLDQRGDRVLYFVVSHFHEDHYNPAILDIADARLLLSYDTVKRRRVLKERPTAILRPDERYSDELLTLHALHSTDVGISSLTFLADGTSLYHAGDNNNWYFPEEPGEHIHCSLHEMEGLFLSTVRAVRKLTPTVDHLMFPIDPRLGSEMLRGVCQWMQQVAARHLYPMHSWDHYDELVQPLQQLSQLFPETAIIFERGPSAACSPS